jgi:hypothetical protein
MTIQEKDGLILTVSGLRDKLNTKCGELAISVKENDELQISFTFRSGPMIFGRVMALGL